MSTYLVLVCEVHLGTHQCYLQLIVDITGKEVLKIIMHCVYIAEHLYSMTIESDKIRGVTSFQGIKVLILQLLFPECLNFESVLI